MSQKSKLAVIGAGAVGSSIAYASLIRGSAEEIALYDVDEKKAKAEVLDLRHGAMFAPHVSVYGGSDPEVLADASIVVITAGAAQKPGQTRMDLVGSNVRILESILTVCMKQAPDAVYVLVTNPCDVLTMFAKEFTGLPTNRVISSGTVLDTSRLRRLLADKAGVAVSNVHAAIVGEHGDTEFPVWSSASISQIPILDWSPIDRGLPSFSAGLAGQTLTSASEPVFTREYLDQAADSVRNAAYEVIAGKGATNYAIGLAATHITEAILTDSRSILPISTVQEREDCAGAALSLPTVVGSGGALKVLDSPMDDAERAQLAASAEAIRKVAREAGIDV